MVLIYFAFCSSFLRFGLVLSESLRKLASVTFHVHWTKAMDRPESMERLGRSCLFQSSCWRHGILCSIHGRPFHRKRRSWRINRCIPVRAYGRKLNPNTSICLYNRALVHSKFSMALVVMCIFSSIIRESEKPYVCQFFPYLFYFHSTILKWWFISTFSAIF